MNKKFMFGSMCVSIFILILISSSVSACDGQEPENCSDWIGANHTVTVGKPDVVVSKFSSTNSITAGGNFTFTLWVYNYGNGTNGGIHNLTVSDTLDTCFVYINNSRSITYYRGTSIYTTPSYTNFSDSNGNLIWFIPLMEGANNPLYNFTRFKIVFNVTTNDCHGNFTNFVNASGNISNNAGGCPLGYLCEICRGNNYTSKCEQQWNDDSEETCDCTGWSDAMDCIQDCEYRINSSNDVNSRLKANASVEIISQYPINLTLSKSAPQNTTYGAVIQFNISWSVKHPTGNKTNITITEYLPPQVSSNCNNASNSSNCSVQNNGENIVWDFKNIPDGTNGTVYLNVSVISLTGNILNKVEIRGESGNKTANERASSNTEILAGHISGKVFNDINANGTWEAGEGGLSTTIYISGITKDGKPYSITINPPLVDGTFDVIVPYGTYNITAVPITNMTNTTPLTIYNAVVNTPGGSTGNNFGFYTPGGVCPPVNVSCYPNANITIYINGNDTTTTFEHSGRPYNITVYAKNSSGAPIPNATIRIWEWNGHNTFALSQFGSDGANVTNYAIAEVKADNNGFATFTIVPTGGIKDMENYIGPYQITTNVYAPCSQGPIFQRNYDVSNRDLPTNFFPINPPNKGDVSNSNNYIVYIYKRVVAWLSKGGGENHNVTIYTNGTIIGLDFNATSGKPIGLNITALYWNNETPVKNATIRITEKNGHCPFALSQFGSSGSNVTNYMIAEVRTDVNGNARFTIVPTGGIKDMDNYIGAYGIDVDALFGSIDECNTEFFDVPVSANITVSNRDLPLPYPPYEIVPNQGDVSNSNNYIVYIYKRVVGWLSK